MSDFPVKVSRSENGDYSAELVDFPDGPVGRGLDPYAAYEDLTRPAKEFLRNLAEHSTLPAPSAADERPVISYQDGDTATQDTFGHLPNLISSTRSGEMICYSWTNDVVFFDK